MLRRSTGSASLGFICAAAVVMAVGITSMRMAFVARNDRLIHQLNSTEGFYTSELGAWSLYQNHGSLPEVQSEGSPDQTGAGEDSAINPGTRRVITSSEKTIDDENLKKTIRRSNKVKQTMGTMGSTSQFCGSIEYQPLNGKHETCLMGRAMTPNTCNPNDPNGIITFESLPSATTVTLVDGTTTVNVAAGAAPPDRMRIRTEYERSHGVTFCIDGPDADKTCDAAGEQYAGIYQSNYACGGLPESRAFIAAGGCDRALSAENGSFFLSNNSVGDSHLNHAEALVVKYTYPVSELSGQVLDLDDDTATIEALDSSGGILETIRLNPLDAADGKPMPFAFSRPTSDISSLYIRVTGPRLGFAFDNFSPSKNCLPPTADLKVAGTGITTPDGPNVRLTPGSRFTANWTSSNAESCSLSDGGSTPVSTDFSGTTSEYSQSKTLTLTCRKAGFPDAVDRIDVVIEACTPTPPPIQAVFVVDNSGSNSSMAVTDCPGVSPSKCAPGPSQGDTNDFGLGDCTCASETAREKAVLRVFDEIANGAAGPGSQIALVTFPNSMNQSGIGISNGSSGTGWRTGHIKHHLDANFPNPSSGTLRPWMSATSANRNRLANHLQVLRQPDGLTPYRAALEAARDVLTSAPAAGGPAPVKVIFFITDGVASDNPYQFNAIADSIKASGVKIYSVFYGTRTFEDAIPGLSLEMGCYDFDYLKESGCSFSCSSLSSLGSPPGPPSCYTESVIKKISYLHGPDRVNLYASRSSGSNRSQYCNFRFRSSGSTITRDVCQFPGWTYTNYNISGTPDLDNLNAPARIASPIPGCTDPNPMNCRYYVPIQNVSGSSMDSLVSALRTQLYQATNACEIASAGAGEIFATSTTYRGNFAALRGLPAQDAANQICMERAQGAGLSGTWNGLIGTTARHPSLTFPSLGSVGSGPSEGTARASHTGIRNNGGRFVSSPGVNFWKDRHEERINYDEFGRLITGDDQDVWTGLEEAWLVGETCNDWTSTSGDGAVGSSQENDEWSEDGSESCSDSKRLFCIKADAQATPPLSTGSHILFVSSSTHTGNFGGVANADAICTNLARNSAIEDVRNRTNWKAILSTSTQHARDRIQLIGPVVNTRNETVANASGANSLFSPPLLNAPTYNQNGERMPGTQSGEASEGYESVWTGTNNDGTYLDSETGDACSNWTTSSSSRRAVVGNHLGNVSKAGFLRDRTTGQSGKVDATCDERKYIYCIDQPAPPPTTGVTSCTGSSSAPPPIPPAIADPVIFATSTRTQGDMNPTIGGAYQMYSCPACNWDSNWPYAPDLTCQALATVASASNPAIAGKVWKAAVSTSTQSARDRLVFPSDVRNTRGEVVANASGSQNLFSGNLLAPVKFNEFAAEVPCAQKDTWTATGNDGNYLASSSSDSGACTKWYIANNRKVVSGTSHFTNALFQDSGSGDGTCTDQKRLLCVSQPCSGQIVFENPFRIRTFVNQATGSNVIHPEDQAPFFDAATAQKVCELAGYPRVISFGSFSSTYGRNGYDSASGQCFKRWDPATMSWRSLGPNPNTWLSQLTCGCM